MFKRIIYFGLCDYFQMFITHGRIVQNGQLRYFLASEFFCRCLKTPELSNLDTFCMIYGHLEFDNIFTAFPK